MTTVHENETPWKDAIIEVLQNEGAPTHYQRVTELIGERGLRNFTGSKTPASTARSYLNRMLKTEDQLYDSRVRKISKGIFQFVDPDDAIPIDPNDLEEENQIGDDNDDLFVTNDRVIGVPAFGLYWEKDSVHWGRKAILGRQTRGSDTVNFAEQNGVYILHNGRSVVYVGRAAPGTLHSRLLSHSKSAKAMRWDKFSWFGFRDVNSETGELMPLASEADTIHLIAILESVLIEALEPPVNGQRGDYLGTLYEQVPDQDIAKQQSQAFLQKLAGG